MGDEKTNSQPLLDRLRRDRSGSAAADLVEAYYPLVRSVCRRYLRVAEDVEDAVQDTFCKFLRQIDTIHSNPRGWLTTIAYSTCIDLIRRTASEYRRYEALGRTNAAQDEHRSLHEAIHRKLHAALLQMDEPARELIIDRFIRQTPVRVMARRRRTSAATISRQTSRAMVNLAAVLRDMGLQSLDDLTVAEHFGIFASVGCGRIGDDDPLRFASDWRTSYLGAPGELPVAPCRPGWSRPIRLGVFLSYSSTLVMPVNNIMVTVDAQVRALEQLPRDGFEFVSIVEPGTTARGPIECTIRNHELTAGLIDGTQREELETLDVILIGNNLSISRSIVHAINQAVRSGTGLLKESWIGSCGVGAWSDPEMADLLLAEPPVFNFHTTPCGTPVAATVLQEHPVLVNLRPGMQVSVGGCGALYQVRKGAQVLVRRDLVVGPEQHGIGGLGPFSPAAYVVGELGRGRVAVAHEFAHSPIFGGSAYLERVLTWLAEPRREALAS